MKIAFVSTLNPKASTIIGRIIPLATEFSRQGHECHLLGLQAFKLGAQTDNKTDSGFSWHNVGVEPYQRTDKGKIYRHGFSLLFNQLATSIKIFLKLASLKSDIIILVKPLPANTLSVSVYHLLSGNTKKIILDADDFELMSNKLTSLTQRAAIHWSERTAANLSSAIVVATPFLADHFSQLTNSKKTVTTIPTGLKQNLSLPSQASQQKPAGMQLVYLGSLSLASGHRVDLLPEIFKLVRDRFPSTSLFIAGDGDEFDHLKQIFTQVHLQEKVTFFGRFQLSQVLPQISPNTIFLDPIDGSITNRAKSSYRVLLAATLGLPVVTSNIGIRPQILPANLHERLFAMPADSKDYSSKIIALIEKPLTSSDQENLRSQASTFDTPVIASKYLSLL